MRNILEQAIAAILNEESETAGELMRQFIISKSQAIHESLRQGEDPILEDIEDNIGSEQYFTDEDFADKSDDADVDADAVSDVDADAAADVSADDAAGDLADDLGTEEGAADEGSVDDRLDDIEAKLDSFEEEFEKLMAELEGEAGDVDGDITDELGSDETAEADVDGNLETSEDEVVEGDLSIDISHDDDFSDINESILDELEKITVANTEGRSTDGKTSKTDDEAFASQRDKEGGPIETKRDDHVGYDLEAAPKSGRLPKGKNTLEKSTAPLVKKSAKDCK